MGKRLRAVAAIAGLAALLAVVAACWFLRRYFGALTPMQVLYHLQHGGLEQADPALWLRAARYAAVTLALAAAAGWLWLRLNPKRWGRGALWALLGAGAVVSVGATLHDPCEPGGGDLLDEAYVDPARQRFEPAAQRPDLLLVFVESLDEAYAHPRAGTPPLLPQLGAWRQPQRHLGELQMLEGAHWTMGGLFAALCGLHLQPVGLTSRGDYARAGPFFPGGTCLTDLLAAQGWRLSFHGGASLAFAGKGNFLAGHGVQRRFGREEWQARGLMMPARGWGLLDQALLEQVWDDLQRGHDDLRRPPQAHLVLTVDTHAPSGVAEPGCAPAAPPRTASLADDDDDDDEDSLRAAVRCSDRLVAQLVQRFLAQADGRPKLVWVMGDHISPRPLLADELDSPHPARTVFHAAARVDAQGRELALPQRSALRRFSHVDVMPTLLDALGLRWAPQAHRLGLGVSLLAPDGAPTWTERVGAQALERRLACPSPRFQQLWAGAQRS